MIAIVLSSVVSAVVCVGIYVLVTRFITKNTIRAQREAALKEAEAEGEMIKKERILQAKEKFIQLKSDYDRQVNERNQKLAQSEQRAKQIEANLLNQQRELENRLRENERLKELNPAIDITREASKRYLDYMFRMTEANKIKKEIKQRIAELREREIDPSRFVRALVTDPSLVGNRKEQLRFMNDLYCVASVMQDVDYLDCSFYDLFTPDELYAFYAVRNYQMYLEEGPSAEFGHRALSDAVPLLRNFVAEADEAIATGALSASLRYGHDVNVIPLVGLMGIEGCDTRESDYRKVDQAWSCWRVTPLATNIQLVFYRKKAADDVLVKFLYNEREVRIPVASDLAPYYRWNDVRDFYRNVMENLPDPAAK